MSSDCIFCKILQKEIPSTKVYEDQNVYAFHDISPMADEHILFIHKKHSKDVSELVEQDPKQLTDIFLAINTFTKSYASLKYGFRIVTNAGEDAGQTVFHTHFHLLGGEKLKEFGA
jgi:histidine triad (HIT) family protein